ncbi:hypothetical protein [Streptomyces sp. NPDC054887]
MDLESVTAELYGLPPSDFTATRNQRVAAARTAGDRELARDIQALRRPTLSAWASNLLVRRLPEQVQPLISLGEGMRQAHRDLDGEQLRELGRRQHDLVGALARQATALAAEAGQPVGDDVRHEVETTLHAVLADPEAAREWAAGCLTRPLSPPVGFAAVTTAETAETVARRASRPASRPAAADGGRKKEAEREKKEAERARKAREEARARSVRAEKDANAARERAGQREDELARAEGRLREAADEEAELAERLRAAKERHRAAREEVGEARGRAREAAAEARAARRRAEEAAARAEDA